MLHVVVYILGLILVVCSGLYIGFNSGWSVEVYILSLILGLILGLFAEVNILF